MGVRITNGTEAVLYCSTTGVAFGPVFEDQDAAEEFFKWAGETDGRDLRLVTETELSRLYCDWLLARNAEVRASAKELREYVQALKREAEALETPTLRDYAVEGFEESDPTRYREYQNDPRWLEDVLGIAVSAYVRDNGDAVPAEVVERLKIEIDEENTRRGERADERQGLW
jgi:hypothetical protein